MGRSGVSVSSATLHLVLYKIYSDGQRAPILRLKTPGFFKTWDLTKLGVNETGYVQSYRSALVIMRIWIQDPQHWLINP